MRYIPSIYLKFFGVFFCNVNTNLSVYKTKTRAHVQNRDTSQHWVLAIRTIVWEDS